MIRRSSTHEIHAGVWGLVAGIVGSLCCVGPSAAILLGLGASSALLGFSLDRTVALAGGAALLLAGLVLAQRRVRACDLRPAARWRAPALMLVSFAVVYGLLGILAPALAARQEDAAANSPQRQALMLPQGQQVAAAAAPRRLTLSILKMDCPPCAASVRTALKRQKAVRAFVAETGNDEVTIEYDGVRVTAKKLAMLFPARYGVTQINDQAIQ